MFVVPSIRPMGLLSAVIVMVSLLALGASSFAEEEGLLMYTILPGAEVRLQDDYGAMLINDREDDKPTPRYILAIRKSRTLVDTRDLAVFRAALAQVPKGSDLFLYDSCTVPRSYGLTDVHQKAFHDAIDEVGVKIAEDQEVRRLTCYCKALEMMKFESAMAARAAKEKANTKAKNAKDRSAPDRTGAEP